MIKFLEELVGAYRLVFCDPSKELPMPFEDYDSSNGLGDFGTHTLYVDRRGLYSQISEKPSQNSSMEEIEASK